jgi:putative thioredoxin
MRMSNAIDVDRQNFDQVVLLGSTGTPVLVDFWAPWCGPCRQLAPILDRIVAEFEGRVALVKVNTDEASDLASAYGVRGIPNCKLFVDGRVVDEFTGVLPESAVREFLTRWVPSGATPLVEEAKSRLIEDDVAGALELLEQALAIDPEDEEAALTRIEALLRAGRAAEAGEAAEELDAPERATRRPVRDTMRLATLKARAQLSTGQGADLEVLAQRAASAPNDAQARLDYANALAALGDYRKALDELLAIVDADRSYGDEAARKAMLTIFEALGADSELARQYRRELASSLNR